MKQLQTMSRESCKFDNFPFD